MIFVALTLAGVLLFLVAEKQHWATGKWLGKPLASASFVALALDGGALHSSYGRWVAAALLLCLAGDLLLIPAGTFVFGLGAFLVGHLLFAAAFVARGVAWPVAVGAALVTALVALPVGRWLLPYVKAKMKVPVLAYMTAISLMLSLAAASYAARAAPLLFAGAVAFYLSDLSVARDRFVQKSFVNRLWGIPLYYGAQLLFAWSVR